MKRNIYIHVFFSAIALLIIVSFSSCKKEKDIVSSDNKGAKLVFNVSSQMGSAMNNKLASVKPSTTQEISTLSIGNRVNMIADSEENSKRESIVTAKHKFDKKIASNSPVHPYTRYRVLVYNVTKGVLEKSVEAIAENSLELTVTPGDEYKWYAYSYNTDVRIDTPTMVNDVPQIRTMADKEFLWASSGSGTITATDQPIDVSIVFVHRMAEVVFEINVTELHGTITDLRIDLDDPNYFNTAEINLATGEVMESTKQSYNVPELSLKDFEYIFSDSTVLRAVLYTAIPDDHIEELKVHIRKMTVLHDNNVSNAIHKLEDAAKTVQFSFDTPDVSKSHVAKMKFRYTILPKKILHVIGHEVNNDDLVYGFAAQPKARNLTGWVYNSSNEFSTFNMLQEPLNFGKKINSIVHTDGFTHQRCLEGELAALLSVSGAIPDIVIISVYYYLEIDDITALISYLNRGGVVIMMTDSAVPLNAAGSRNEVASVQAFLREFLKKDDDVSEEDDIKLDYGTAATRYYGALMFELDPERSINDRIIKGPFGDLTGKYWGNDSYAVVQAKNLPIGTGPNDVTVYSNQQAVNSALAPLGVSMFKHNSKDLFWIGDGSFLSHPVDATSGWSTGWGAEPFATVSTSQSNPIAGEPNHVHYPVPKPYGVDYNNPTLGSIGFSHGSMVYNAPLFANLMAWAVYRAEFFGINRGTLIPAEIKDWNVNGGSVNYNYNQ